MRKIENKKTKEPISKKQLAVKIMLIITAVVLVLWILLAACLLTLKLMTYEPVWDNMYDEDYKGEYDTYLEEDGTYYVVPLKIKAGFIFYTGGLVEYTAYLPLMEELASRGILCVLPKLPLNLAFLDVDAAAGLKGKYADEIPAKKWFIGGHSLGGVAAAQHFADTEGEYYGLILLASYSTVNLTDTYADILSIYGSEDGVLNMERYEENKVNIDTGYLEEFVIEGGNHAGFGNYGSQRGDGVATVTSAQQKAITADKIYSFIFD